MMRLCPSNQYTRELSSANSLMTSGWTAITLGSTVVPVLVAVAPLPPDELDVPPADWLDVPPEAPEVPEPPTELAFGDLESPHPPSSARSASVKQVLRVIVDPDQKITQRPSSISLRTSGGTVNKPRKYCRHSRHERTMRCNVKPTEFPLQADELIRICDPMSTLTPLL